MEKIYEQTMLFDFYGELLTEHQRSVYADAVYNDLSLGEIAEERGISRQGVHDLIKRCDKILRDYESRLHLVERFARAKETVREIQRLSGAGGDAAGSENLTGEEKVIGERNAADDGNIVEEGTGRESPEGQETFMFTESELRDRLGRISRLSQELLEEL